MSSTREFNRVYSVDVLGNLDVAYKKMAINALYGMIQGNADSAAKSVNRQCKNANIRKPEQIIVTQNNKINDRVWIGRMDMVIIDGENEFWVYRDWSEEMEIDKVHPKYDDDWFYESNDCESYKRWKSLFEQHNIEWKGE